MSLLQLGIHMLLPGQKRIQDFPVILDRLIRCRVTLQERGPKKAEFPFPCKYDEFSFIGINRQTGLTAPSLYSVKGPLHEPR